MTHLANQEWAGMACGETQERWCKRAEASGAGELWTPLDEAECELLGAIQQRNAARAQNAELLGQRFDARREIVRLSIAVKTLTKQLSMARQERNEAIEAQGRFSADHLLIHGAICAHRAAILAQDGPSEPDRALWRMAGLEVNS